MMRIFFVLLVLGFTTAAQATTFVPMEVEDLTRSADAVVIAAVAGAHGEETSAGRVVTRVLLQIERVLAGHTPDSTLTLHETGGQTAERGEIVFGAPQYQVGDRVVAFLRRTANGHWRTAHLGLGCFHVEEGVDGSAQAVQRLGRGAAVVISGARHWRPRLPLDELIARVAAAGHDGARITSAGHAARDVAGDYAGERTVAFVAGAARFFEIDEGEPLTFHIDSRGDALLGLDASRMAMQDAFRAWTDVANAPITLEDGGLTDSIDGACTAGEHLIRFEDPDNEIDPPVDCQGVLGVGGSCFTNGEEKVFGGARFARARRALVTFADGWQGCAERTACNFAEVATHEVGHALGLDHSSEDPDEPNDTLSDATMYFLSHFDGRCAGLGSDDINGVSFIYPVDVPITITTPSQLPGGVARSAYQVQLTTSDGTGNVAWTTDTTICSGFPGLTVTPAGVIEGTPTATGSGCFSVRATDQEGDSHLKRLEIAVAPAGSSTNTPTATRTPTQVLSPTPTRTPVATATPGRCVGDCDNSGSVRVNELVSGVNIALDRAELSQCPSFDLNRNLRVEVNELVSGVNSLVRGCTL